MVSKKTYQNTLTRTLLNAALLLSIFSLTGNVYNYQSKLVQATKTELVVRNNFNFKRCISYKRIIQFGNRNDFSKRYLDQIILALESLHTNLNAVKLKNASKQFLPEDRIVYQKTVPTDSKSNENILS